MHTDSYIYLLANKHNNVLYTGVTVIQHAKGTADQQLMGPPKMANPYLSNLSTFI